MNNPLAAMQQFRTFVENFQKMQRNPKEVVQELLNSGQMSQQQYENLRKQANQIMGMNL